MSTTTSGRNWVSLDGRTVPGFFGAEPWTDTMRDVLDVYPSWIEHALLQVPDIEPHSLLVVRWDGALNTLEVQVEARLAVFESGRSSAAPAR